MELMCFEKWNTHRLCWNTEPHSGSSFLISFSVQLFVPSASFRFRDNELNFTAVRFWSILIYYYYNYYYLLQLLSEVRLREDNSCLLDVTWKGSSNPLQAKQFKPFGFYSIFYILLHYWIVQSFYIFISFFFQNTNFPLNIYHFSGYYLQICKQVIVF